MRCRASTFISRSPSRPSRGSPRVSVTSRNTPSSTPVQRAVYLQWLAGGRTGPLPDLGYAAAVLLWAGAEADPRAARPEPDRQGGGPPPRGYPTTGPGPGPGPFESCVSNFLAYSLAREGIDTLQEKWFGAVFKRCRALRDEQHLAVGLAWLFTHGRPLPVSWAQEIARLNPKSARGASSWSGPRAGRGPVR